MWCLHLAVLLLSLIRGEKRILCLIESLNGLEGESDLEATAVSPAQLSGQ